MPSATSHHSSPSLDQTLHSLQSLLHHSSHTSHASQLSAAKIALLHHNALLPTPTTPSHTLALARSILEVSALLSIRARDPAAFIRYYTQLQPFYDTPSSHAYPPSHDRSKITGLYLMLLLSQGDYAGFHTVLEGLVMGEDSEASGNAWEQDEFISYPVELERNLMEGSYDQVWQRTKGEGVPGEEFALFSDILISTIRLEIASCAARSYTSLSIASAKNLLYLDSEGAVVDFAREQGWALEEGRIYFPVGLESQEKAALDGDQKETIGNMLGYARGLEMIV